MERKNVLLLMIAIKKILRNKKMFANRRKAILLTEFIWKKQKALSQSISDRYFSFFICFHANAKKILDDGI